MNIDWNQAVQTVNIFGQINTNQTNDITIAFIQTKNIFF